MAVKAQGDVPDGMQRVYRRFERCAVPIGNDCPFQRDCGLPRRWELAALSRTLWESA
jgi:hypothetical protein